MKQLFTQVIFAFCLTFFGACSGNSLVDDSTGETKTLVIQSLHDTVTEFSTDEGVNVSLATASISWGHLNLVSSGDDEDCVGGNDTELHIENSIDLLDETAETSVLGEEEITDTGYCSYILEIESLHLAGTWALGEDGGEFDLTLSAGGEIEGEFMTSSDEERIAHPLHFHEGDDNRIVTFTTEVAALFAGIDFSATEEDQLAVISENLAGAITQDFAEHE